MWTDPMQDASTNDIILFGSAAKSAQSSYVKSCVWKEELESLFCGGVPMAIRKEPWKDFVATRTQRIEKFYNKLLIIVGDEGFQRKKASGILSSATMKVIFETCVAKKWKSPIEKGLLQTFPGHLALGKDCENAFICMLTAYVDHNLPIIWWKLR